MDIHGVKAYSTIGVDPQTHHMTGVIDQLNRGPRPSECPGGQFRTR